MIKQTLKNKNSLDVFDRLKTDTSGLALLSIIVISIGLSGCAHQAENISPAGPISQEKCAGIVYNETSGLRPVIMTDARVFIASVAYKRQGAGMADPKIPSSAELQNPTVRQIWSDCTNAAFLGLAINPGKCIHFVIWPSDDGGTSPTKTPELGHSWPYDYTPDSSFGPYKNPAQVGDVPVSDKIYIFKYCTVPLQSAVVPVGRLGKVP
jgi:hypothetical protein